MNGKCIVVCGIIILQPNTTYITYTVHKLCVLLYYRAASAFTKMVRHLYSDTQTGQKRKEKVICYVRFL